jgi:hypothetical protein
MKESVTVNICRPTFRGIGNTPAENSWFPLWLLNRMQPLQIADRPDVLFYGDVGNGEHLLYPARTIRVFLTGENIKPNWEQADYALTHKRIWNDRHWRAPLWRHFYDPGYTRVERNFEVVKNRVDRFCNFIYSNDRATERIEFFKQLNARKSVDSGGRVLNNIGGPISDKRAYLSRCKFTIAFENESHSGYATEKIIEPLLMGSIPIYWGDPDIEHDFNPECLINVHKFKDFESVIEHVLEVDRKETLWQQYVTAPLFAGDRMPECLTNDAYRKFFEHLKANGPQIGRIRRWSQQLSKRCLRLVSTK